MTEDLSAMARDIMVSAPAPYRLYRATAVEHSILCPRPPRQPCALHGIAVDHRATVTLWPA